MAIVIALVALRGPLVYESQPGISPEEFQCAKGLAHVTLDNPIQRAPLKRVEIGHDATGTLIATAYFMGGINYTTIAIEPDCRSARRQ